MVRIRVLIADDHSLVREGIRALLAAHDDIEIVGEAADGREAVDRAHELAPDVVLIDIAMPIMDGLEATRRILKERQDARIIIVSQYVDKEYVLAGLKAGATGFISKKALASELVAAIGAVHRGGSVLHPSVAGALINDYRQRSQGETDPYERLTPREREVLKLLADGRSSREIAELLVLSVRTVVGHRMRLMEKLDIHSRAELIKYAIRKGLISVDSPVDDVKLNSP